MVQIVYDAKFIAWLLNKHHDVYDECVRSKTFESITPEIVYEYAKDKGLIENKNREDKE